MNPVKTPSLAIGPTSFGASAEELRRGGDEEVARHMEATFLSLLVKEMRQSLPGEGLFGGTPGAAVFEGFFDTLMADSMSQGAGTGLRESILASIRDRGLGPVDMAVHELWDAVSRQAALETRDQGSAALRTAPRPEKQVGGIAP